MEDAIAQIEALQAQIKAKETEEADAKEQVKNASSPGTEPQLRAYLQQCHLLLHQELVALRQKENLLLQAQLGSAAAGPGPSSAEAAGAAAGPGPGSAAARDSRKRMQEALPQPRSQRSFSSVGSTEASGLLRGMGLSEFDGLKLAPAEAQAPEGIQCEQFDWSAYRDENAASGAMLAHHQQQLEKFGIKFGAEGFEVFDNHAAKGTMFVITANGKEYRGVVDGFVAPFGLMPNSAAHQIRIAYEHKMCKGPFKFSDRNKGQAVMELLGAFAHAQCPVLLDLTDGVTHHILTIRGNRVYEWIGLNPTQAYALQAKYLLSQKFHTDPMLTLGEIPNELRAPVELVRKLNPPSALAEQLESVIPFLEPEERVQTAFELIHTWVQAQPTPLPLPACVEAFYS